MDISKLDKKTLEFAIKIAWQYRFMCKDTIKGRAEQRAYKQVEDTLEHYLKQLQSQEVVK